MHRGIFIVGTDTDVGKTHQAVRLAKSLRNLSLRVGCYKPVASGSPVQAMNSDASLLAEACGVERNLLSRVCPQAFSTPLAPPVAATLEGKSVDEQLLVEGALWWRDHCDFLIIEGAGGLMSPISHNMTVIDLAMQLGLSLLLVVANRLGCVSHTILAAEALKRRELTLNAIVLNSWLVAGGEATEYEIQLQQTNRDLIQQFLPGVNIVQNADELSEAYAGWVKHEA